MCLHVWWAQISSYITITFMSWNTASQTVICNVFVVICEITFHYYQVFLFLAVCFAASLTYCFFCAWEIIVTLVRYLSTLSIFSTVNPKSNSFIYSSLSLWTFDGLSFITLNVLLCINNNLFFAFPTIKIQPGLDIFVYFSNRHQLYSLASSP